MKPEDVSPFGFRTEDIVAGSITTDGILGTWAHYKLEEQFGASIDPEDLEEEALMDPMEFTDAVGSDEYGA